MQPALARATLRADERVGTVGAANDWFAPQTLCFLLAPQLLVVYQGNKSQYVEQYMFVVQRELPHQTVFELGYLGNQGHHLRQHLAFFQGLQGGLERGATRGGG